MNCEKCQDLISDFLDGALSHEDQSTLNAHLEECLQCAAVRNDLQSIVGFCRTHRGEYTAPPNEQALWLRVRDGSKVAPHATVAGARSDPAERFRVPLGRTGPAAVGSCRFRNWLLRRRG